jgi:hypothetical protein
MDIEDAEEQEETGDKPDGSFQTCSARIPSGHKISVK